jgi:hypothetical protein
VKATLAVCTVYVVACCAALAAMAVGALGWETPASRPGLRMTDLLGMPWSLLVGRMADPGAFGRLVLGAATMALNLAIIFTVGRWLARRV